MRLRNAKFVSLFVTMKTMYAHEMLQLNLAPGKEVSWQVVAAAQSSSAYRISVQNRDFGFEALK